MNLKTLGDRILIRPDTPAPVSDLIVAPDTAQKNPDMSGTVIALGSGSKKLADAKRNIMREVREIVDQVADIFPQDGGAPFMALRDELGRYGASRPTEYDVEVGDHVLYTWNVGTTVVFEDVEYVLINEEDIAAVIEDEEESAA